jgi:hypothetical protein
MTYRGFKCEVTELSDNQVFMSGEDPWSSIHPGWLREFRAEQRTLYGELPSLEYALSEWNNREYFYSVLEGRQ